MDSNSPGLRALGPADEPPVPPLEPAAEARRLLEQASAELIGAQPRLGYADVLSSVGRGWAALAHLELAERIAAADERRNVLLEADASERREAMARQAESDERRWRALMQG